MEIFVGSVCALRQCQWPVAGLSKEPTAVEHDSNRSSWEVEAADQEVEGHPQLHTLKQTQAA